MAKAASRTVAAAMAIAGRASRACDVCASKSARWYCGADAAYLCDRCDTQVHSANSLSLRHERVRLTPSGTPRKTPTDATNSSPSPRKRSISKILHSTPPQVLPSQKRSRTTRPHPHHRAKPKPDPKQSVVKTEVKEELIHQLTFDDLFDTEDFLIVDDTQEVPSLITVGHESSSPSPSSELDSLDSFDAFSPDFHAVSSPSEDSFAAYFKGKAAHDDDVMSDQFLVPDAFDNCFDTGIEIGCDVSLAGEACFIPGDIPGLDGFEDFGSRELESLSLDLELRATSPDADSETGIETSPSNVPERDEFATGPFAKFFATRPKSDATAQLSAENIKSEAKAILKCCMDGLSEEDLRTVPTLRLNYDEVITAWSDRGEPWVNPDGLVPEMGHGGADDDQSSGGREARVMRYKEKRRSRLFSKTIRYEVRKLNAERRPRMKGRFVKRTNNSS